MTKEHLRNHLAYLAGVGAEPPTEWQTWDAICLAASAIQRDGCAHPRAMALALVVALMNAGWRPHRAEALS